MINFKEVLSTFKAKATSPTAYSWYGVAGVVATGVLTFISTTKWIEWKDRERSRYATEASRDDQGKIAYETMQEKEKNPSTKQKIKEAAGTVAIFTPPFLAAIGTSWCIRHGNTKALDSISTLEQLSNRQAARLDKYKGFAAGALASELKDAKPDDEERVCNNPHNLYFSDDDLQHEDYGEQLVFYIEGVNTDDNERLWFRSTKLEVMMAEYEFNKLLWNGRRGEFASLNELLTMFDAEHVSYGDGYGWSKEAGYDNGYDWVGFNHKKIRFDDGTYGYLIIFESEPTFDEVYEWFISDD